MPANRLVINQLIQRVKCLAQGHFIVEFMQSTMTRPANADTGQQLLPSIVFSEKVTSVQFAGNQMVKGQLCLSFAKLATPVFQFF